MDKLIIEGNKPLKGEIEISGSKNATLPILAASLLTDETCVIRNVPKLRDTMTMIKLLRSLGKTVETNKNQVTISSKKDLSYIADYKMVSTMRGSFCVLGPLLAKLKQARVSLPGGCVIGVRPVDLHLKGIKALGAKFNIESGYVLAKTTGLKGNNIYLGGDFGPSVLATANVLMAATLAKGTTVIESAACEPEMEDLANFLISMGADIIGQGTPKITVKGVKKLRGARFEIGPDRIEAGTYIILAAATKSNFAIKNVKSSHLLALIDKLRDYGIDFDREGNTVKLKPPGNLGEGRMREATTRTTNPKGGRYRKIKTAS